MLDPSPGTRHRHVEHVMGTVFSIDIRTTEQCSDALDDVVRWLHRVDAIFSTYRVDSDISRINRRELRAADADPLVAEVLSLCASVQSETDGWFCAIRGGRLDPTGLVKGWAVQRASAILHDHGFHDHLVNGGGDVQTSGSPRPGELWTVGIADPRARDRVLTTVAGTDLAVATSGSTERGAHIVNPYNGRPATSILAATVVGPEITKADVYATAAFARGQSALTWIDDVPGYECLLVTAAGEILTSRRFTAAAGPRSDL